MLPVLYFVPLEAYQDLLSLKMIGAMLLTAVVSVIPVFTSAIAMNIFIVGFASLLVFSASSLGGILIDALVFNNYLSFYQIILIVALLCTLFAFIFGKENSSLVRSGSIKYGVIVAVFSGLTLSVAYAMIGEISKQTSPLMIGYFWELSIGVTAMVMALVRGVFAKEGFQRVSLSDFWKILLYSSPTVLGTCLLYTSPSPRD